jgi:hypothetical protein
MQATAASGRSTDVGIAPPHASTVPPPPMQKVASAPPSLSLPPILESLSPQLSAAAALAPNPPPPATGAARDLQGKPTQSEIAAVRPGARAGAGDALQHNTNNAATQAAMNAATVVEPAPEQGEVESSSRAEPGRFAAPTLPLADAVLAQLSEVLRKYPEVEWACEVSDGSATPVIGLRISPAFMTRAEEIRAGLAKIASSSGVGLTVAVLTDRDRMREARAEGHAFFPWRRRGKKG